MTRAMPNTFIGKQVVYIVTAPEYPFKDPTPKQLYERETYPPSIFSKESVRNTRMEGHQVSDCEIIMSVIHPEFGPVFLLACGVDFFDGFGACCADTVAYYAKKRMTCIRVVSIELVIESCNPRSFITVVNSAIANLYAKVRYIDNHSPDEEDKDTYEEQHLKGHIWTPRFARSLFPNFRFSEIGFLRDLGRISDLYRKVRFLSPSERRAYKMLASCKVKDSWGDMMRVCPDKARIRRVLSILRKTGRS